MNDVCDVCEKPVDFDPMTRTFAHRARTWCRGIDGVVLSAPHSDRVERRRAAPAPLHPIKKAVVVRPQNAAVRHDRRVEHPPRGRQVDMSEQSSASPTPQWRDPLFSPGDRFPLGAPEGCSEGSDDEPSGLGTRPFSLRRVVRGPRINVDLGTHYRYCPDRQVSLVLAGNGSFEPLLNHTRPGPTPVTSGFPDGQPGNPPPEEMARPDYQSD